MLTVKDKVIEIYGADKARAPLVVLNAVENEGKIIFEKCREMSCPDFTIAVVSSLDWNDDLSPWEMPAVFKGGDSFGGKAYDYLMLLTREILPEILKTLAAPPEYTAIAGYSLAGLFALYAAYKSNTFSRIASASGSMWFSHFTEFVTECEFERRPDCVYLSLGDKESRTRNEIMKQVQANTQVIYEHIKAKGINSAFELNSGNHFTEPELRMAKGIRWILSE